ncbi:hypothetical protein ACTXT7_004488 [Hymenolepis weldensis]
MEIALPTESKIWPNEEKIEKEGLNDTFPLGELNKVNTFDGPLSRLDDFARTRDGIDFDNAPNLGHRNPLLITRCLAELRWHLLPKCYSTDDCARTLLCWSKESSWCVKMN